MGLPDPSTVRTDPCPDGHHYEWVPEPAFGWLAWRVVTEDRQCSDRTAGKRCPLWAVAKLQRGKPGKREQWWHYCAEHMYGRAVDGQRVWVIHTIEDQP